MTEALPRNCLWRQDDTWLRVKPLVRAPHIQGLVTAGVAEAWTWFWIPPPQGMHHAFSCTAGYSLRPCRVTFWALSSRPCLLYSGVQGRTELPGPQSPGPTASFVSIFTPLQAVHLFLLCFFLCPPARHPTSTGTASRLDLWIPARLRFLEFGRGTLETDICSLGNHWALCLEQGQV